MRLQDDVVFHGSLGKVVPFDGDKRYALVRVSLNHVFDLLNERHVVADTLHGASHISVVVVANRIVERLKVSDENLALPLLRRCQRVSILVQEEGELETRSIDQARLTLTLCARFTCDTAKNGIGKNWRANRVKASTLGLVRRRNALRDLLGVRSGLVEDRDVGFEVLHRRLNDATLASDWFVTEVVQGENHAIQFGLAAHDGIFQQRDQVQVLSREEIVLSLILIERCDPACVNSEESAKFLVEEGLLDVSARKWWHPEFLWISLHERVENESVSYLLTVV